MQFAEVGSYTCGQALQEDDGGGAVIITGAAGAPGAPGGPGMAACCWMNIGLTFDASMRFLWRSASSISMALTLRHW